MADWESHRDEAFLDDVRFFKDGYMTDEQIADRLGVSKDFLQKRLERARKSGKISW